MRFRGRIDLSEDRHLYWMIDHDFNARVRFMLARCASP